MTSQIIYPVADNLRFSITGISKGLKLSIRIIQTMQEHFLICPRNMVAELICSLRKHWVQQIYIPELILYQSVIDAVPRLICICVKVPYLNGGLKRVCLDLYLVVGLLWGQEAFWILISVIVSRDYLRTLVLILVERK